MFSPGSVQTNRSILLRFAYVNRFRVSISVNSRIVKLLWRLSLWIYVVSVEKRAILHNKVAAITKVCVGSRWVRKRVEILVPQLSCKIGTWITVLGSFLWTTGDTQKGASSFYFRLLSLSIINDRPIDYFDTLL